MLMKNMISFFSFGIEHNDGTLPSMRDRVGEDIDDDHSGNNQTSPMMAARSRCCLKTKKPISAIRMIPTPDQMA